MLFKKTKDTIEVNSSSLDCIELLDEICLQYGLEQRFNKNNGQLSLVDCYRNVYIFTDENLISLENNLPFIISKKGL